MYVGHFNCSCVDFLLDNLCIHPHCGLKVSNCMDLHFVPAEKMVVKDDIWGQILGKFIGAHFSDLNPNFYDMNDMKFGLDVSTKVKFERPGHKTRVIIGFFGKFCSASLKALTYACAKMKSLAHETEYNKNTLFHFFQSFSFKQRT